MSGASKCRPSSACHYTGNELDSHGARVPEQSGAVSIRESLGARLGMTNDHLYAEYRLDRLITRLNRVPIQPASFVTLRRRGRTRVDRGRIRGRDCFLCRTSSREGLSLRMR